ncbi:hypothetical protein KAT36_00470 [Candidatus Pacearchaeota archaeon]|nr:hypothetical protein [Candidatus Pacearchaeota archaeon]
MNSKETSLIVTHPFIQGFVFSIIRTIGARSFEYRNREVVHADLVPKVSENVMKASLGRRIVEVPRIGRVEVRRRDMGALVTPIGVVDRRKMEMRRDVVVPQKMVSPRGPVLPPTQDIPVAAVQDIGLQVPQGEVVVGQDYGKIIPLLSDPSVSSIECCGMGKPISIIRAGQRQMTKIVLNGKEIGDILEKMADAAHVPLVEGVFRVMVNGLSVNAVISEIIGSRFVIKKATAYGLLEK